MSFTMASSRGVFYGSGFRRAQMIAAACRCCWVWCWTSRTTASAARARAARSRSPPCSQRACSGGSRAAAPTRSSSGTCPGSWCCRNAKRSAPNMNQAALRACRPAFEHWIFPVQAAVYPVKQRCSSKGPPSQVVRRLRHEAASCPPPWSSHI